MHSLQADAAFNVTVSSPG